MIGRHRGALANARAGAGNTYIVFSSDNGYHMGEYRLMPRQADRLRHRHPRAADRRRARRARGPHGGQAIAENIDLRPTFERPRRRARWRHNVDGRSLVPLLHGQRLRELAQRGADRAPRPRLDAGDPDCPRVAPAIRRATRRCARRQACMSSTRHGRTRVLRPAQRPLRAAQPRHAPLARARAASAPHADGDRPLPRPGGLLARPAPPDIRLSLSIRVWGRTPPLRFALEAIRRDR